MSFVVRRYGYFGVARRSIYRAWNVITQMNAKGANERECCVPLAPMVHAAHALNAATPAIPTAIATRTEAFALIGGSLRAFAL